MAAENADVSTLVDEYSSLMDCIDLDDIDWDEVLWVLNEEADWSRHGANHLIDLVQEYGSFVLRNALALALVLGVEDGTKGI